MRQHHDGRDFDRTRPKRRLSRVAVAVAFAIATLQVVGMHEAFAAAHTWTGATSTAWSNAGNWSGGTPSGDATAALTFPSSGVTRFTSNNDLAGTTPIASMTFQQGGFLVTGNAISVTSGLTDSAGSSTVNAPLSLTGTPSFSVASTG